MTQQEKNWNDTEENLKKEIKKVCPDIQIHEHMIQRAHRQNSTNTTTTTPSIYANITYWKDAQLILDAFKNDNITNKNSKIYVEQLYSPSSQHEETKQ